MDIKSFANTHFIDIIKNHYVDYQGKADRPTFWYFVLCNFIVQFVIALIFNILGLPIVATIISLAFVCPSVCLAIRRMRDTGLSPWLVIGMFIPLVNLVVLVLLALPSKK